MSQLPTQSEYQPTDHLRSHKGRKFNQPASAIVRKPIVYHPSPDSGINTERLPNNERGQQMELAYREQPFSMSTINAAVEHQILWMMAITSACALLFVSFVPMLSWIVLAYISGGISLLLVGWQFKAGSLSFSRLIACGLLPPVFLFGASGLAHVTSHRLIVTALLGIATVTSIKLVGDKVLRFQLDWMLTHPRLKPESRRNPYNICSQPNWLLLIAVLLAVLFVPIYSNWLSLILIIGLSVFFMIDTQKSYSLGELRASVSHNSRDLVRVLANYRHYGTYSSHAPGVWKAAENLNRRKRNLLILIAFPTFTLSVATGSFLPWDIPGVQGQLKRYCSQLQPDTAQHFAIQALLPPTKNEHWPNKPHADRIEYLPDERIRDLHNRSSSKVEFMQRYDAELEELNRNQERFQNKRYGEAIWLTLQPELRRRPYKAWILILYAAFWQSPWLAWLVALALLMSGVLPFLVLVATYSNQLESLSAVQLKLKQVDVDERTEWQWFVDRIRSSSHSSADPVSGQKVLERDHIFLGVEPNADFPVLVHKQLLAEHAYIVGDSGSGKTSLGLMPMLIQLIRGETAGPGSENSVDAAPPPPIVILDLKGDMALFNTVKHEGQTRQAESFFHFTPEKGRDSCYFNPFQNLNSDNRSLMQLAQILLDSLGLNHGEGYGRSYFSRRTKQAMVSALQQKPQPDSIAKLSERLAEMTEEEKPKETFFELFATIQSLRQYPQLSLSAPSHSNQRVIHMPTLLEKRQIVYYWLPAALESVSVREIGKLALFSMLTAAIDRQRQGLPVRQSYLVIDEFQRIAGENFKIILEQARSFGISVILANQSRADLQTPSADLRSAVNTNTRFKQFFSVTDPMEMKELSELSGDELAVVTSQTFGSSNGATETFADTIKPKLMRNDILRISDHPLDSIIHISRGSGYSQFGGACLHVRSTWPISKEEYAFRSQEPWPETQAGVPSEQTTQKATVASDRSPQEVDSESIREMNTIMRKLYEKYESELD